MSATFFVKLIPPRPSFASDMTADERVVMQQHVAYTQEHFAAGRVLIYGPVMATGGAFGIAVMDVEDEAEARRLMEADPSVKAGVNTYELWPMHLGGAQGRR